MTKNEKIDIIFQLDYQNFEDMLVAALEGGSNYWYLLGEYPPKKGKEQPLSVFIAEQVWNGASVDIFDVEDEKTKLGELNIDNIKRGASLAATKYLQSLANLVDGSYDAADADVLFQLIVLGDVVYG